MSGAIVGDTLTPLDPFGVVIELPPGTAFESLDADRIHAWVATHRLVVLRGLRSMPRRALPLAFRRLGPLQAWAFGAINELKVERDARNYLYTPRAVPLHWDGAFADRVPRYLCFHCDAAPPQDAGGETVFVDTTRVWQLADDATRDRWRALRFHYRTERVVHYGGGFVSPVVAQHPYTGDTVLRFAEPVDDLNPVSVAAEGLDPLASAAQITALRQALHDPRTLLAHRWRTGDVVVADNHALVHGRRPFAREAPRHLRRVNVHGPERGWRDTLRDSVRIRRPEFLAAEIPIFAIAALLAALAGVAPGGFGAGRALALIALFFLLFHVGDMANCLADRALDAVYKTRLSEAVWGLGVRCVGWQIAVTAAAAVGLAAYLAWARSTPEILGLVVGGLVLGTQYSFRPLWLKSRGAWQIVTLWTIIFVGPMLLVARVIAATIPWALVGVFCAYGALQQGIILLNTAEDLPEDRDSGVRTSAIALGLGGTLLLASILVGAGGAGVGLGLWSYLSAAADPAWLLGLVPFAAAWSWVFLRVVQTHGTTRRRGEDDALVAVRAAARRMPIWITATAWGALVAAICAYAAAPR
jgi:alpha-ketoglutarate-dependent taurine dioxygenase/4-hydroxybenzoate polyprenyltransferase